MQNRPMLNTVKWQEQQWRAGRQGAHPTILEFERVFIERMAALGVPMFAHTVIRTYDEQLKLFHDGHSKDSPLDGLWPHKCAAVDIVHSVRAWDMHRTEWALVGHVGKELAKSRGWKLDWGGDWKFYDPAHWQLTGWQNAMAGYPYDSGWIA